MSVPAALIALALGAALAGILWRMRRENARLRRRLEQAASELEHLQRAFGRFAPDQVVERVIAEGVGHHGERREVTVLFADLVGFTALSERVEPDVLVRILNGYFERMSQAITEHRGHVSTFIGDGILALFGALAPNPWQANDAVLAAGAMRAALADYNRALAAEGLPALEIGIGVHRGEGVVGLVGSRDLIEFSCIGLTTNVAARVQDLTRQHPADVIVTEAVRTQLDPRVVLRPLPPTMVKGVAEPVVIFAVDATPGS